MRLIHTESFEIRQVDELLSIQKLENDGEYAIVSHRWSVGDEDVFPKLEILHRKNRDTQQHKQAEQVKDLLQRSNDESISKIRLACREARKDKIPYVWIDTCCIDRRDLRELSQALNSMFRWYKEARICYTYLSDVEFDNQADQFKKSAWFTRGWTLQELLAPGQMHFFDLDWTRLGTKKSMLSQISEATNIKTDYLKGDFTGACIAERMSWASGRTTKIRDDMAYSMLGIFGITMDVRYGEEEDAFLRLEETLIEKTRDESIFAWKIPRGLNGGLSSRPALGLLAPWPSCFSDSRNLTIGSRRYKPRSGVGFSITKQGVEFAIPMILPDQGHALGLMNIWSGLRRTYKLGLNCWTTEPKSSGHVIIHLKRDSTSSPWQRVNLDSLSCGDSSLRSSFWLGISKTRQAYISYGDVGHGKWGKQIADFTDEGIKRKLKGAPDLL